MKRTNNIKFISIILASALSITACSVDFNMLSEGVKELGSIVPGNKTEQTEVTVPEETTETTTEIVTETTVEATPTPIPTATLAPTATPMPERVDFSNLTKEDVIEGFGVNVEDFSEHYEDEEARKTIAKFEGQRMLVDLPENPNVQQAINLYLDAFYQKAAGEYSKAISEAKANYALTNQINDSDVKTIVVSYDYSSNGRILSVAMAYGTKVSGTENRIGYDFMNFDMITGQIVTIDTIAKDPAKFKETLKEELINSIKLVENAETDNNNPEISKIITADEILEVYMMTQMPGAQTITAEIYGIKADGEILCGSFDLAKYIEELNSFGQIAYGN